MSTVVKDRSENSGFSFSSEPATDQCMCVGKLQRQRKNCQKREEATIPGAHIGPRTI